MNLRNRLKHAFALVMSLVALAAAVPAVAQPYPTPDTWGGELGSRARLTGDIGVVMGREVVFPSAASEQSRMYGQKTLSRRYTNVYLREAGIWRHIARHANIIP